jgi:uncharacterized membrane protein
MNPILLSAVTGALAMYFLDPQAGRRRRARTRDKMHHARRKLREAYHVTARDTAHRIWGLAAETQRVLRREPVSDEVLRGRVRATLGRYVSHPHAVHVAVSHGWVTLSGPILAHEVHPLLRAVKHVAGVRGIDNHLEPHDEPGNIPSLQGGAARRGQRFELLQDNWSPAARLVTGLVGSGLILRGGILGSFAGGALLARALSNLDLATLVGLGDADDGIEVQKTINVNAPVEQVFRFWTDYENFPRFMANVLEVRVHGNRSHWVVHGPAGVPVEWNSEVSRTEPNALIEWRSTPDSPVKQEGSVRFEPNEERGTRVTVHLRYLPPVGALGHAVATIFGADPKHEMDADLMRMKTMIETGKPPHDAAARRMEKRAT